MKNLNINTKNIEKLKKGFSLVTVSLATAMTLNVNASAVEITPEEFMYILNTGAEYSEEMTPQEHDELIDKTILLAKKNGADLMPKELEEVYNEMIKENSKINYSVAALSVCELMIYSGEAGMMTLPESVQFENICEKAGERLEKEGITQILSVREEGEYTYISAIINQAVENRSIIETSVRTASATDRGYYDYCFGLDENPNTGLTVDAQSLAALGIEAGVLYLSRNKKKEKQKVKTK